jgi:hypothetical protein
LFAAEAIEACGAVPDEPAPAPVAVLLVVGAAAEAVPGWFAGAAVVAEAGAVSWPAAVVGTAALWDESADGPVAAGAPPASVAATAGADWLLAAGAEAGEAALLELLLAAGAAVGASALDPEVAVDEAVVAGVALGWLAVLSEGLGVLLPKPRITAATMIATTANPSQRERFTEPRNRPVTCF